ncbi:MAG: phosphoribosylformylglycinamidine synthase subunit PurL, partial [Methanobacteriota archaeon]
IGEVTDEPVLSVYFQGKKVAELPPESCVLGGGAPVYHREYRRPEYLDVVQNENFTELPEIENLEQAFWKVFRSQNIVSRRWVYEQYDTQVQTNTVILPGGDAAVVRIKGTRKALAMKTDCNGRYVYLNPRRGAQIAVAEAARNVVATGAQPLAITNCLNFGNPYKPEMFYLFREAVAGMGEACRVFDTPVTGGNVSFYNESPDSAVYPTPTIGMVGLIEDIDHITTAYFKNEGDLVYLIGETAPEIGGSEFLKEVYGKVSGDCPALNLELEHRTHQAVLEAIRNGWIQSAHDLADGGLAIALAECCILDRESPIGAEIKIQPGNLRPEWFLFSESQSRFLLSVAPERQKDVESFFSSKGLCWNYLGKVGGNRLQLMGFMELPLEKLIDVYYNRLQELMESE